MFFSKKKNSRKNRFPSPKNLNGNSPLIVYNIFHFSEREEN